MTTHSARIGGLAQLAERLLCMQKVRGSIPLTSIRILVFHSCNNHHFYFSHPVDGGGRQGAFFLNMNGDTMVTNVCRNEIELLIYTF